MVTVQKLWWWFIARFLQLRGMRVGWKSYVGPMIFLYGGTGVCIGEKVRVFPGARMETHEGGRIDIRNDVSIGQNFHVTSARESLIIGAHTTISGNVFVTNIDHEYQEIGIHILAQPMLVRNTEIGENCFIGYGAAIQAGTVLGRQCVVGANSVVRGVFPDYCVIVGAPARVVKRYDVEKKQWIKIEKDQTI